MGYRLSESGYFINRFLGGKSVSLSLPMREPVEGEEAADTPEAAPNYLYVAHTMTLD